MILRKLDPTDSLDELTGLIHRAYRQLGDLGWNCTGVNQSVDVTRERIDEAECWIADLAGPSDVPSFGKPTLVGTILVRPPNETGDCPWFAKPGVAVINQFAVEPSMQGTGLGTRLMEHAEHRAKEMGAKEIALDTPAPAEFLLTWYRNRGYRIVDTIQWEGKTYRSAVMAKQL